MPLTKVDYDPFAAPEGGLTKVDYDPFTTQATPATPTIARPSGLVRRVAGDGLVTAGKAAMGLGETLVGLANIPTMGYAGKALESVGYDPKLVHDTLGDLYSPEAKASLKNIEDAKGFGGTIKAAIQNPLGTTHKVLESVPQMIGGAGLARKGLSMLPAGASAAQRALVMGAGEGIMAAGSAAEGIRQQTDDGLLTGKQVGASLATGAGTALIGAGGGRLAQTAFARRLGIVDPDAALAGMGNAAGDAAIKAPGLVRRALSSAATEGLLEEMPQSASEQALQNFALDRPIMDGVPEAAGLGTVMGGVMGGGFGAVSKPRVIDDVLKQHGQEPQNKPDFTVDANGNATVNPSRTPRGKGPQPADTAAQDPFAGYSTQTDTSEPLSGVAAPLSGDIQIQPQTPAAQIAANMRMQAQIQRANAKTVLGRAAADATDMQADAVAADPFDLSDMGATPNDESLADGFTRLGVIAQGLNLDPEAIVAAARADVGDDPQYSLDGLDDRILTIYAQSLAPTVQSAQAQDGFPSEGAGGSQPTPVQAPTVEAQSGQANPVEGGGLAVESPVVAGDEPALASVPAAGTQAQEVSTASNAYPQEGAETRAIAASEQTEYDQSEDILDSDITTPSGTPFTIRDTADKAAARHEGGRVFPVDGGFVVRVPSPQASSSGRSEAPQPVPVVGQAQAAPVPAALPVQEDRAQDAQAVPGSGLAAAQAADSSPSPQAAPAPDSPQARQAAREANVQADLLAKRDAATERLNAASAAMQQFPAGDMGLTPDTVKATPEWKAAKIELDRATVAARNANAAVVKASKVRPAAPAPQAAPSEPKKPRSKMTAKELREAEKAKKQARRKSQKVGPARKPRDLLDVIARSGGLNREAFRAQGVDPAEFNRQSGIRYVFRKNGGMSLSDLREWMQQEGYLPRDPEDGQPVVDDNDALDLFDRALRGGQAIYAEDQWQDVAEYEEAKRQADAEYEAEMRASPAFGDGFDSVIAQADNAAYVKSYAELTEEAYDLGATAEDIIEASFRADPAAYLQTVIERLSNENDAQSRAEEGRGASRAEPREEAQSRARSEGTGQAQEVKPASVGLFGTPTAREVVDAAARDRDAKRDGKTGTGRTDMAAGDGELFAGPRPAQARVDEANESQQQTGRPRDDIDVQREEYEARRAETAKAAAGKAAITKRHRAERLAVLGEGWKVSDSEFPAKHTFKRKDGNRVVTVGEGRFAEGTFEVTPAVRHASGRWEHSGGGVRYFKDFAEAARYANESSKPAPSADRGEGKKETDGGNVALENVEDSATEWLSYMEADESRTGGDFDADRLGLRGAVNALLGKSGLRVEYLRGYAGLPDNLRNAVESRNAMGRKGQTAALYDPATKRVFVFTHVVRTPERAAWNAAHEIAGHDGLRKLLGKRLDEVLELADKNPTVSALADEIAVQRKLRGDQRLLAVEEALAELAAAVRTGDYGRIQEKYQITVPQGIRARIQQVVENFIRRLKELLQNRTGVVFKDADVRALLENAWQAAQVDSAIGTPPSALESTEDGPFGPIYESPDFEVGIDTLLREKNGELKDGMFHPSIGYVDVVYGERGTKAKEYEDGYGLAKIAAKHPEVYLHNLADELSRAPNPTIRGNTATFDTPTYTMVVKRDWKGDPKNWLLTAFEPKSAASGSTRIGAAAAGAEARSGQDTAAADSSMESTEDQTQGNPSILESVEDIGDADIRAMVEYYANVDGAPTEAEIRAARKEWRETERALGGREAYDKAKGAGKTKLTYGQWVTVRTPRFKRWFGDWEAVHHRNFLDGKPVATLTGSEFVPDGVPLTTKVPQWYAQNGHSTVEVDGIGQVLLDEKAVKNSISHGIGRDKVAAFAAVPDVLRNGRVIHQEHMDGSVGGTVFHVAAPISMGGRDYVADVFVRSDANASRMYVHEVVLKEKLQQESAFKTSAVAAEAGKRSGADSAGAIRSVLQDIYGVNPDTVSKVIDQETGEPMVASILADVYDLPGFRGYATSMPEAMRDELESWGFASKSPASNSFYSKPGKSWTHTPEGILRISDHWNWKERDGSTHMKTDVPVENNSHWTLARYDDGVWTVIKSMPMDWTRSDAVTDGIKQVGAFRRAAYQTWAAERTDENSRKIEAAGQFFMNSITGQIKSATANIGTFNESGNILQSKAKGESTAATAAPKKAKRTAEQSQTQGKQDADKNGIRKAVEAVLGKVGVPVDYLHGIEGLEGIATPATIAALKSAQERRGTGTAGLYLRAHETMDGKPRAVIFTDGVLGADDAAFVAAHEVAGHHGLRALLGDRLDAALKMAMQNPVVSKLAEAIAKERGVAMDTLATEEALSELQGALRTGDFKALTDRYGVAVPESVKPSLKNAIANFVRRLGIALNKAFGRANDAEGFTDAQLRDLLQNAWRAAKNKNASVMVRNADGVLEQVVFHGTPYKVDRFSMQKIGTGEGAQAYGWGLYFASLREIAEHYRNTLSRPSMDDDALFNMFKNRRVAGLSVEDARKQTIQWAESNRQIEDKARAREAVSRFTDDGLNKGNLYRVEIPEDSDLLDWDKPLSKQPEKVRAALRAALKEKMRWSRLTDRERGMSGERIYKILSDMNGPQRTSEYLNKLGIPGLRYLDGNSRNAGEGSHNYVIWDENAIGQPESVLESTEGQAQDNPSILESVEDDLFEVNTPETITAADLKIPGQIAVKREGLKGWLNAAGKKLTDLKPAALALVPLNHLTDFASKGMTAVQQYVDQHYAMQAYRNGLYRDYDAIAQDWLKYASGTGVKGFLGKAATQAGRDLSDLMHDSTIAGIDPSVENASYKEVEKQRIYNELRARYMAMPEQGQALFNRVRDAYTRQSRMLEEVIEANLKWAMEINKAKAERDYEDRIREIDESSASDDEKARLKANAANLHDDRVKEADQRTNAKTMALRATFESMRVEAPYFPLKRYGNYWVTVLKNGTMQGFSKFQTAEEQDAFVKQMKAQGFDVRIKYEGGDTKTHEMIDPSFIAEIEGILDGAQMPDSVKDDIWQAYLERMPDMSLRKSFIHRQKVQGYHPDALKAFSSTSFHGSYQLARLKYGMEMAETLDIAEKQAARVAPVQGEQLVGELRKRHAFIMNPTGGALAQGLTTAAFVYYLGANPAHLLLNAMQTVMLGIPILGTRYGFGRTTNALQKAMRDFARGKGQLENANLTADERKAFQAFIDSGLIDKTQAHDLAGVGETGVEYNAVRQKVMNKIGWFFHQSERFNREVTAMVAYRLARQDGRSHDVAVSQAMRATYDIHFDYSAAARARVMQGDVAKSLLVFRNYQVNILYRLFRDIHQSLRGESVQVRREARKQLGAMMGMYGLFAGVAGMPFYGLAMALAGAFEDDDDPETAEQQFVRGTVELLGPDVARVLLKGVPGATFNIDLTDRIGMPNLWFRSPDRELEGRDAYYYWMEQVLGAGVGVIKQGYDGASLIFDGLQDANSGHVARGFEKMLPAAVRNVFKSVRYGADGVTTLNGENILDLGAGGLVAQGLGYTPLDLAERYDANRDLKNANAKLERRRRALLDRLFLASQHGDPTDSAMLDIQAFNAKNPDYAITRQTIGRSAKLRNRNRLLNENGIVMTRRMRRLRERMEEGGED